MKKTICDFCGKELEMMDEYVLPRCQNKDAITPYDE